MSKTYRSEGIVLKRINYAETDRIVTIFTKEYGKVTAIAKGVRRLTSKKAPSLEPATQAVFFFVRGKSLDLLTQSQIISSFSSARSNLTRLTQIYQVLEIVDLLTVEFQESQEVYRLLLHSLKALEHNGSKKDTLLENIRLILKSLGFTYDKAFTEQGLKKYIEQLAERRLRSKAFLTTQRT